MRGNFPQAAACLVPYRTVLHVDDDVPYLLLLLLTYLLLHLLLLLLTYLLLRTTDDDDDDDTTDRPTTTTYDVRTYVRRRRYGTVRYGTYVRTVPVR